MTAPADTIPHDCPNCETETDHVRRTVRDKRRSFEAPAPARSVLVCMVCNNMSETLPSGGRGRGD